MPRYTLTEAEKETATWTSAETDMLELYTTDPKVRHRMDALCRKAPDLYRLTKEEPLNGGRWYTFPKRLITFRTIEKTNKDGTKEA